MRVGPEIKCRVVGTELPASSESLVIISGARILGWSSLVWYKLLIGSFLQASPKITVYRIRNLLDTVKNKIFITELPDCCLQRDKPMLKVLDINTLHFSVQNSSHNVKRVRFTQEG